MPNKKINELSPRTPSLTDLIIVGDPSTGYSYKATISVLAAFAGSNIQFSSLGGISLTSPSNGQYLTFNGTNWVNSTLSTTTWDTAYNRSLTAAAVSGTTTKTLTLTKQDGSTLTASWSDLNTDAVTSVFGRTGVVVAAEGDYSLDQLGDVIITTPSTNQVLQYNGTSWVNATFVAGINSLNGLTATTQTFATGTSGTDFAISSTTSTHTFNLPTASAVNRGALSSADWSTFNSKVGGSGTTNYLSKWTSSSALGNSLVYDNGTSVGINTATPSASYLLDVNGAARTSNTFVVTGGTSAVSGVNGLHIWFSGGNSANIEALQPGTSGRQLNLRGYPITFMNSHSGGEMARFTTNGRLLIGTTTESTYELDVVGDIRSTLDANINGLTVGKGGGNVASNTVVGSNAGVAITTATFNTLIGFNAGRNITNEGANTFVGWYSGQSLNTGYYNTAVGVWSLTSATSGNSNVALGMQAGEGVTTGSGNVFVGMYSGDNVTQGIGNTIVGYQTGRGITTGNYNTIIGRGVSGLSASLSNTIILADGQGNQRFYINSSGNVGIGTTSPTNNSGYTTVSINNGTTGSLIEWQRANTTQFRILASNSIIGITGLTNIPMVFETNNSERMRIFANGNFGIGTTTDAGYKLDVNGTARFVSVVYADSRIETPQIRPKSGQATVTMLADYFYVGTGGTLDGNNFMRLFATNTVGNITGTGTAVLSSMTPTINQTVGTTARIIGYRFNPTNTAVLSKVYAFYADSGNVNFSGLPTSSAGLVAGDLWNDGGTLKIV